MPYAPETLLEHTAFVRAVAQATLRGDDLVDDVVQETMLTALEESHHRRGPLRAWLAGVARNKARSLVRQRAARRRRDERAARPESTDGADLLVARAEEGRSLVAAVLALDERHRQPILLRYYEGLPPREIARRLGVPVETARTRIKRGLEKLRAELDRTHGPQAEPWRAALLPLLQTPSGGAGGAAALIAGGSMLGKKASLCAVLVLLLVGGGIGLRARMGDDAGSKHADGVRLASPTADGGQPQLEGLARDVDAPPAALPAPVGRAEIDRDRALHGFVVRADGVAVAGASVTALYYRWGSLGLITMPERVFASTRGPATRTAADGSFKLTLVPGDLVHLRVEAPGFATKELTDLQAGERVRVVLGEPVRLVVVATAPDGTPVIDMPVRLFTNPERTGVWLNRTVQTGPHGRATFEALPPGLSVWIDPQPDREGVGDPGWVEVGLPSTGTLTKALQLPAGAAVHGRVIDGHTGKPIAGARVSTNWAFLPFVRTDADGRYVMHGWTEALGPDLHVAAPGYTPATTLPIVGQDAEVRLGVGRVVRGRIVDGRHVGVAGAIVGLGHAPTRHSTPAGSGAVTGSDGSFEIGAAAVPVVLVAHAPGQGRLVRLIGLEQGPDVGDLVLPEPCTVAGRIVGDASVPAQRMQVILTPAGTLDRTLRRLQRHTDDLGRFRFPDLAPGAYELTVGPRTAPVIRRRVEVTPERPRIDLALTLDGMRTVVVRVTDPAGTAAPGVLISARRGRLPGIVQGTTGADGRVALELPQRPCELAVSPTVGLPYVVPAPLEIDALQTHAEISLIGLVAIRGSLLTPDEQPIAYGFIRVDGEGDKHKWIYTDDQGRFVAQVSADARVSLTFEGTVEEPMSREQKLVPFVASVSDVSAGTVGLVLRSKPLDMSRELTLRVVDPSGRPVSGVTVNLMLRPLGQRAQLTGPDGRARSSGLPALPLSARISWMGSAEQPWLAPQAVALLPEGQERTLRFRQGVTVDGYVLGVAGKPLSATAVAVLEDGKLVRGAFIDKAGYFTAIVDPQFKGITSLRCEGRGASGERLVGTVDRVASDGTPVTIQLEMEKK